MAAPTAARSVRALLLLCWALFAWLPALAQGPLPVPALTARVIDQTGTLDDIQRQGLEQKLQAFEQKKGAQIVVLMVRTTQPEDITSYANRVGNAWKIGRKDVGDGVLLIVAKEDRRVRIEVAKTLEGAVPDLAAKQIIDTAITPKFRANDYAGGLQGAADQLIARISGEALPEPAQPSKGVLDGGFDWLDLAIFLLIAVPVVAKVVTGIFGRKFGAFLTGGGVGTLATVITSSLFVGVIAGVIGMVMGLIFGGASSGGRRGGGGSGPWISTGGGSGGGWSSGSSGGGGFSSGGGGDFGGGGASGDW